MSRYTGSMNKSTSSSAEKSREERLAVKLRENLRRRKGQARDQDAEKSGDLPLPKPVDDR